MPNERANFTDICVLRLSAIGDTCHALAVIRRLQDNWPSARISWIIGKTEARLMDGIDGVELLVYDKTRGRSARNELRERLADRHFDVALCMHASLRANRLCHLIPSARRIGFDRARARDFQWLFTNERIAAAEGEHALDAMLGFAARIGAGETALRWDIPIPPDDVEFARTLAGDTRPLVVISPCSSQRSRNYRNWPVARFVDVARALVDRHRARIVVTGGPTPIEKQYGDAIADAVDGTTNLVARTDLKRLLAVIDAAAVLVCPDSGPAHMATAVGTPVVGLYATSNPARTGPYRSQATTVNRYPDACRQYLGKSPAELRWGQRVRHRDAMLLIEVDDVVARLDAVLSGRAVPARGNSD